MKFNYIIIFVLLLNFFSIHAFAFPQDSLINCIFNLAYNQEYKQAEILLEGNKTKIDEFHFAVLNIDISYWKNVTGTLKPNYKAFEKTLEQYTIDSPKTCNQKGIQLIQLSYQLRYELKRFKLINAISTHAKSKNLFEELKGDCQFQSVENRELYQLYISLLSYFSNYIMPFSGKSGKEKCKQALANMEELALSERLITKTLASYFLGKMLLKYEKTPGKSIPYFQTLNNLYPGNKRFPELLNECIDKANR